MEFLRIFVLSILFSLIPIDECKEERKAFKYYVKAFIHVEHEVYRQHRHHLVGIKEKLNIPSEELDINNYLDRYVEAYYHSMFTSVNRIYRSLLKNDLLIQFKIGKIYIAKKPEEDIYNISMNPDYVLNSFCYKYKNTTDFDKYNVFILLKSTPGFRNGRQYPTIGLSYLRSFCHSELNPCMWVYERLTPDVAITIAHELGHFLGLVHNSDYQNLNCTETGHLMDKMLTVQQIDHYKFTKCSRYRLVNALTFYNKSFSDHNVLCMDDAYSDTELERHYSNYLLGSVIPVPDNINFINGTCFWGGAMAYEAHEGTKCDYDKNKICLFGECVDTPNCYKYIASKQMRDNFIKWLKVERQ